MSIQDQHQRQLNIRRDAPPAAAREVPSSPMLPPVFLGVIVNVIDAKNLCVRRLKPGESIVQLNWATRDAFEDGEIEVALTAGQLAYTDLPIVCFVTQAQEIVGLPLHNDAGSYESGDPDNHTCVPSPGDLLPDVSSGCGEPDIFSGEDCGG